MNLVPPAEAARRARAAIAYAGLEDSDIVKATGIKPGTLRNIVSKTRPSAGSLDNLVLIADACKVPRAFMELGWGYESSEISDLLERMTRLEEEVSRVLLERGAGGVERANGQPDRSEATAPAPDPEAPEPQEQQ